MKKLLPLLLIYISIPCFSQSRESLDGFWGIKWGESIENTTKTLEEKGFSVSDNSAEYKHHSTKNSDVVFMVEGFSMLSTSKGKFTGEDAEIFLDFIDAKLYRVSVTLFPKKDEEIKFYNDYCQMIADKYGTPDTVIELKGKESDIMSLKELPFKDWRFKDGNSIFAMIRPGFQELIVAIIYENAQLNDIVKKRKEETEALAIEQYNKTQEAARQEKMKDL